MQLPSGAAVHVSASWTRSPGSAVSSAASAALSALSQLRVRLKAEGVPRLRTGASPTRRVSVIHACVAGNDALRLENVTDAAFDAFVALLEALAVVGPRADVGGLVGFLEFFDDGPDAVARGQKLTPLVSSALRASGLTVSVCSDVFWSASVGESAAWHMVARPRTALFLTTEDGLSCALAQQHAFAVSRVRRVATVVLAPRGDADVEWALREVAPAGVVVMSDVQHEAGGFVFPASGMESAYVLTDATLCRALSASPLQRGYALLNCADTEALALELHLQRAETGLEYVDAWTGCPSLDQAHDKFCAFMNGVGANLPYARVAALVRANPVAAEMAVSTVGPPSSARHFVAALDIQADAAVAAYAAPDVGVQQDAAAEQAAVDAAPDVGEEPNAAVAVAADAAPDVGEEPDAAVAVAAEDDLDAASAERGAAAVVDQDSSEVAGSAPAPMSRATFQEQRSAKARVVRASAATATAAFGGRVARSAGASRKRGRASAGAGAGVGTGLGSCSGPHPRFLLPARADVMAAPNVPRQLIASSYSPSPSPSRSLGRGVNEEAAANVALPVAVEVADNVAGIAPAAVARGAENDDVAARVLYDDDDDSDDYCGGDIDVMERAAARALEGVAAAGYGYTTYAAMPTQAWNYARRLAVQQLQRVRRSRVRSYFLTALFMVGRGAARSERREYRDQILMRLGITLTESGFVFFRKRQCDTILEAFVKAGVLNARQVSDMSFLSRKDHQPLPVDQLQRVIQYLDAQVQADEEVAAEQEPAGAEATEPAMARKRTRVGPLE
jgi:hypothetical protein